MQHGLRTIAAAGVLLVGLAACKSKIQETAQQPAPQPQSAVPAPVTPPAPGTPAAAPATPAAPGAPAAEQPPKYFVGTVAETMNAGGYTYVQVDNGSQKIWAAAPQFDVKKGEKVTVPEGMPMQNYESKTLNRTFDVVYFVGAITKGDKPPAAGTGAPGGPAMPEGGLPEGAHPKMDPAQAAKDAKVSFAGIKKADKTIGEVYGAQSALGGKDVVVRGKVVKFSPQIMGKNWVHVQDGSGQAGSNDLTVTTADSAKVGDTVLVKGKITLKKDFGMGYKYDLIIEDGHLTVE